MIDITGKINSLRIARAGAVVKTSDSSTIDAIKNNKVPKGDVFEMSKAAALLAIKQTSNVIPDCHPLPIEFASVKYTIDGLDIQIEVEVKTIYKTGVEVEAMHGASVAALTIYDMLKPIDKKIEIASIKLLEKRGGKSQYTEKFITPLTASVIVCSDSVSRGKKQDMAGKAIVKKLEELKITVKDYVIIPDEQDDIRKNVEQQVAQKINMIILTGGTGLSPRDQTPEALLSIIEKKIPGIEEAMRNYGQQLTPYSMLSRSVAGLIKNTLILALPGSTRGAQESMNALFPFVMHIFKVMEAMNHEPVKDSFEEKH
jgi:cyclic pyranopterin phosphate synthase